MGCVFFGQAHVELRLSDLIVFVMERKSTCPTGGKLIPPSEFKSISARRAIAGSVVVLGTVLLLRHVRSKNRYGYHPRLFCPLNSASYSRYRDFAFRGARLQERNAVPAHASPAL